MGERQREREREREREKGGKRQEAGEEGRGGEEELWVRVLVTKVVESAAGSAGRTCCAEESRQPAKAAMPRFLQPS